MSISQFVSEILAFKFLRRLVWCDYVGATQIFPETRKLLLAINPLTQRLALTSARLTITERVGAWVRTKGPSVLERDAYSYYEKLDLSLNDDIWRTERRIDMIQKAFWRQDFHTFDSVKKVFVDFCVSVIWDGKECEILMSLRNRIEI